MPEKALIATQPADGTNKTDGKEQQATSTSQVKRLEGTTTIDDKVFIECEMLAHLAISRIAARIASEVGSRAPSKTTVILLDPTLISALQMFAALELQLVLLTKAFDGVAPPAQQQGPGLQALTALSIAPITAAASGVLDLLGLFRQDAQFSGRTVVIKENALYLEVARALRDSAFDVLFPRLLAFQASQTTQASQTVLTELFDPVFKARQDAAERLRPLLAETARLQTDILSREREFAEAGEERKKLLTKEIQDLKVELVAARKNLDPDLVLFENTDTQWNDLRKGLNTADAKTDLVPLHLLGRAAEAVSCFRAVEGRAIFLFAEGIVAGGTTRIRRSLLRTLFSGDGLEFSGGAIVAYGAFDGSARVIAAGTHRFLTGFQRIPSQSTGDGRFNSF